MDIRVFTMRPVITAAALCFSLAACSSPPKERIVIQRVEVPIYQPCNPVLSAKPIYPTDAGPISTDIAQQMKDLHEDRKLRKAREMELEAGLKGCASHPPDS